MPYVRKKKYVRKNKKRSYARRRTYRKIPSGFPMPKSKMLRFKYIDNISLNTATGVPTQHFFRANSLYDPDYTGTGHQPHGTDEMGLFFNHYTVISSKITVKFNPLWNGINFKNGQVGIQVCSSPDTISNITSLLEQGQIVYKNISQQTDMAVLTKTMSTRKFLGLSKTR